MGPCNEGHVELFVSIINPVPDFRYLGLIADRVKKVIQENSSDVIVSRYSAMSQLLDYCQHLVYVISRMEPSSLEAAVPTEAGANPLRGTFETNPLYSAFLARHLDSGADSDFMMLQLTFLTLRIVQVGRIPAEEFGFRSLEGMNSSDTLDAYCYGASRGIRIASEETDWLADIRSDSVMGCIRSLIILDKNSDKNIDKVGKYVGRYAEAIYFGIKKRDGGDKQKDGSNDSHEYHGTYHGNYLVIEECSTRAVDKSEDNKIKLTMQVRSRRDDADDSEHPDEVGDDDVEIFCEVSETNEMRHHDITKMVMKKNYNHVSRSHQSLSFDADTLSYDELHEVLNELINALKNAKSKSEKMAVHGIAAMLIYGIPEQKLMRLIVCREMAYGNKGEIPARLGFRIGHNGENNFSQVITPPGSKSKSKSPDGNITITFYKQSLLLPDYLSMASLLNKSACEIAIKTNKYLEGEVKTVGTLPLFDKSSRNHMRKILSSFKDIGIGSAKISKYAMRNMLVNMGVNPAVAFLIFGEQTPLSVVSSHYQVSSAENLVTIHRKAVAHICSVLREGFGNEDWT